jgi:hypothetical protein
MGEALGCKQTFFDNIRASWIPDNMDRTSNFSLK